MEKYSNISQLLTKAINTYLGKDGGNTEEEIRQAKVDELIGFYENALLAKEPISVVFNTIREDGTLICHGKHVRIEMPSNVDARSATFAGRLNHVYHVEVSEVNAKDAVVIVKQAYVEDNEYRRTIEQEILECYQRAAVYVKEQYADTIREHEEEEYERFCKHLDPIKDAEKIRAREESATRRAIGEILEVLVQTAKGKQADGKELDDTDRLFLSLVIPAKVYTVYTNRSTGRKKAGLDILGLYINGEMIAKYWQDRFNTDEFFEQEILDAKDRIIDVAVIGYNENTKRFQCSRRAVVSSQWEHVDEILSEGNIVQVRCIAKSKGYHYGCLVGLSGNAEEETWNGLTIQCGYPSSTNALRHNVVVEIGGIYLVKIKEIDKEGKRILASTIRRAGNWERG